MFYVKRQSLKKRMPVLIRITFQGEGKKMHYVIEIMCIKKVIIYRVAA